MAPPEHTHFRYEHCDVPEGASLTDWRRESAFVAQPAPGAMRRLLQRLLRRG